MMRHVDLCGLHVPQEVADWNNVEGPALVDIDLKQLDLQL